MADVARELELVKLASRNLEQFGDLAKVIEAKLRDDPEEARSFVRPCAMLLQRLLEAQASIEELIQKLYAAERVVPVGQR